MLMSLGRQAADGTAMYGSLMGRHAGPASPAPPKWLKT
jgi:hypothetical protein